MNEDTHGVYASGVEKIVEDLRRQFLEEAADSLRNLEISLNGVRGGSKPAEELVDEALRVALPLRSQTGNYGTRLIGTVAHRMEDYLANAREMPPHAVEGLQAFVDVLLDLVEGRTPMDSDAAEVVRGLPAKLGFGLEDIEIRNIEVMLVMLHGAQTHYVERELQQCGYRTSTVSNSFDALPLIVRTKPDLVVISAMMPDLDGIDLAIALASMPATRNIPAALITSLDPDDEGLKLLPKRVPIIFKGPSFGDDLFTALDNLFLI